MAGDVNGAKRKAISKKVRFEVLKRDSFTCQYCGQAAPDVILHIYHIEPVCDGGDNDIANLITSCADCNAGKGPRHLDDNTVVVKQKEQLDRLNERRVQLEMLLEWKRGLAGLQEQEITSVAEIWSDHAVGYSLNETGLRSLRRHLKKFGARLVIDAIEAASLQYMVTNDDGGMTQESIEKAWRMVPRICTIKKQEGDKPYLRDLYYIRGIVRNRFPDEVVLWHAAQLLEEAICAGASIEELTRIAKGAAWWSHWKRDMTELLEDLE